MTTLGKTPNCAVHGPKDLNAALLFSSLNNSIKNERTLTLLLVHGIHLRSRVWECSEEQADRHTDGRDQYTFRLGYV